MFNYPKQVRIVEVAPRDGLQAEKKVLSLADKIEWVNGLTQCGYRAIEIGSLVNYKFVPQMQQTDELFMAINKNKACQYFVLTGNYKSLEYAIDSGVQHVSLLCSASSSFSEKNTHRTQKENLDQIDRMLDLCHQHQVFSRVYLSCSYHCPYEGEINAKVTSKLVERICANGCDEISLADSTGKATILQVQQLLENCIEIIPSEKISVHFHNSYQQALANTLLSLQLGVQNIDTSVGGLGGCPIANDSSAPAENGNLATETLLHMLQGMKISTGVSAEKVQSMKQFIFDRLK